MKDTRNEHRKRTARAAAIHDISGIGRCSLSVILPIISMHGIQACPVPTAVLSSHTGGFENMAVRDLTDYIPLALEHYKRLGFDFDCVYSGYLASVTQVDHCLDFFASYPKALKIVDPVMADNGEPYKMCTAGFPLRMRELAAVADIITPNITEAAMLLGENPRQQELSDEKMKRFLTGLAELGPDVVVITSVSGNGRDYNICYEKKPDRFWKMPFNRVNAFYPGTGDIFASVLAGSVLRGESLPEAVSRASVFVETAVKSTAESGSEAREGIMFESSIELLISPPAAGGIEFF